MASTAYTQAPISCSDVGQSNITSTAATCPGNGTITVPALTQGYFRLTGPGINGYIQQDSPVFESLNAGDFTVTLYCPGQDPRQFPVTVENRHTDLQLALAGDMLCADQGTITATATGGFNQGGTGVVYQYGIWSSGVAGANRPDGQVTYGSSNVFSSLAAGTYFVRVKDNCNNFYTQTISISPSASAANLGYSGTWVCSNGALVRRATVTLSSSLVPLGYKYKVEAVGSSGACADRVATSTIVAEKNMESASETFDIPAGVTDFRITTISPCGTQSTSCQSVPATDVISITARRTLLCGPGEGGALARVTYVISGASGYTVNNDRLPGTLLITGGGGFSRTINIANTGELSGALNDVPQSAFPLSMQFTDNCGATRTIAVDSPGSGTPAVTGTPGYARNCVDPGHVTVTYYLNGGFIGVGQTGTKYELLDASDNVVAEGEFLSGTNATNGVRFVNVPANATYRIRITLASGEGGTGSTCSGLSPQVSGSITVPANQGFNFSASPSREKGGNYGTTRGIWNMRHNSSGQSATNGFRIERVGGGFTSTTSGSGAVNNVPPGEYNWSVTFSYNSNTCTRVISGTMTVEAWQVDPSIDKALAVVCQDIEGNLQPTGSAMIEFAGYGPFIVERKLSTDAAFTLVESGVAGPAYSFSGLTPGSTYQFRITDQCGKTAVQQATVKPLSPRIITNTIQPPCGGGEYRLTGLDYGDPSATYEWSKDGNVIGNEREYVFSNYAPANDGTYKLKVTLLNGCVIRETSITLDSEQCGQPFPLGSLGDYVWYDANYDGLQDGTESPAPDVPVSLEAYIGPNAATPEQLANPANWTEVATTTTDGSGKYLFGDLQTGYYRVKFGSVAGYEYTGYQTGGGDTDNRGNNNDSNAGAGGYSGPVYIDAYGSGVEKDNMTIDAGLVAYGSIGDYVWFDDDKDGLQDPTEPGVAGVTVNLLVKDGDTWVPAGTTTTDNTGKYLFDKLKPGTYQVEFVAPDEREFTHHYIGGESNTAPSDSDADRTTGRSGEITINVNLPAGNVGRDNMTIDAGLVLAGSLPVRLSHFNAEKTTEGTALLTWSTTEELNSSYFDVLQSADGTKWQSIGRVEAKGSSQGTVRYTFTDQQPNRGANYYRLKMVDLDGSFEHSNIRRLNFEGAPLDLTVYPNPVSDRFSIKTTAREKVSKVEVFDVNGRLAIVSDRYTEGEPIVVKGLSGGTYILKITMANGASEIRKIVISNK